MKESEAVKRCDHLAHLPSGKCLGCGEQHQPLSDYEPGDDEAYLAEVAKDARTTPPLLGDYAELVEELRTGEPFTVALDAANAITALQRRLAEVEGAAMEAWAALGFYRDDMPPDAVTRFQELLDRIHPTRSTLSTGNEKRLEIR